MLIKRNKQLKVNWWNERRYFLNIHYPVVSCLYCKRLKCNSVNLASDQGIKKNFHRV